MLSAMTPDQLQRYITVVGGDSHNLKFILDAGVLKFLFYQTVAGGKIYYDTVKQDGGRYQRVNYNFQTEFDGLLTSDAFVNKLKTIDFDKNLDGDHFEKTQNIKLEEFMKNRVGIKFKQTSDIEEFCNIVFEEKIQK